MIEQTSTKADRVDLLAQISATDFILQDLKLFLDTHPCNAEALALYRNYVAESKSLKEKYTAFFGPLMAETYSPEDYWAWIDNPWPWQHQI